MAFFAGLVISVLGRKMHVAGLYVYGFFSAAAFMTYFADKQRAKKGQWRIGERVLHLLALLGGWPGAAMAQQILRHKSQKRRFRVIFVLTVLLNTAVLIWLHTPAGAQKMQRLLAVIPFF